MIHTCLACGVDVTKTGGVCPSYTGKVSGDGALSIEKVSEAYGSIVEASRQLGVSRQAIYSAIREDRTGSIIRGQLKNVREKLLKKVGAS